MTAIYAPARTKCDERPTMELEAPHHSGTLRQVLGVELVSDNVQYMYLRRDGTAVRSAFIIYSLGMLSRFGEMLC